MIEAFVEKKDKCVIFVLRRMLQYLYDPIDICNSFPGCQSIHTVDNMPVNRMMDRYSDEMYTEDCLGLYIEGHFVLIYIWDFVCDNGQYSICKCFTDI